MAKKPLGQWNSLVQLVQSRTTDEHSYAFKDVDTVQNAIHASLLYHSDYTGDLKWRVLFFRADTRTTPFVLSRIWNPNFEDPHIVGNVARITQQDIPFWGNPSLFPEPYLFCSGHTFLGNGKLLVVGGHLLPNSNSEPFARGTKFSFIYDTSRGWKVATAGDPNPLDPGQLMEDGRWYPTVTLLPDGKVLAMSGYKSEFGIIPETNSSLRLEINDVPEIYDPETRLWTSLGSGSRMPDDFTEVLIDENEPQYPGITYPHCHVIPFGELAGQVLYTSPQKQAWVFNPYPEGFSEFWNTFGNVREGEINEGGCTILMHLRYNSEDAVIVTLGGGHHEATDEAYSINLNDSSPEWNTLDVMSSPRSHANAVLLPDGTLLVIGGNKSGTHFEPVYHAEIYNPNPGAGEDTWTVLPEMLSPRNYHSTAILLPDGRVWVGGGDFKFDESQQFEHNMNNMEIFSPGYLFDGDRPIISSCPSSISYTGFYTLITDKPIDNVVLIKTGSTTHAFDMSQRAMFLEIELISEGEDIYEYKFYPPGDTNIMQQGIYMLFANRPKDASNSGLSYIPSVASFVLLN